MSNEHSDEVSIIAESRYLRLVRKGKWEYVQRSNASGVVTIVSLTHDDRFIFVEQYRPPVGSYVIEFPSGLAGDIAGEEDESFTVAAQRELMEETGYEAAHIEPIFTGPASAGLTDETITFYIATGLRKVSHGGGDSTEQIVVHSISRPDVFRWLNDQVRQGKMVANRVYAGICMLEHADQMKSN